MSDDILVCKGCSRDLNENEELYCVDCQVVNDAEDQVDREYLSWKDRECELELKKRTP